MTKPQHPSTIREDGTVLAGGMRLCRVDARYLEFPDRYHRRCLARGSEVVRVPIAQFLQELDEFLTDAISALDHLTSG